MPTIQATSGIEEQSHVNICLISQEYPPDIPGGVGTYTRALAHGLTKHGHEVHVLSLSLDGSDRKFMDGAVHVHRVVSRSFPLPPPLGQRMQGARMALERSVAVMRYLRSLHREVDFDIVEAQSWGAESLFYSLRPMAPLIIRVVTPLKTIAKLKGEMRNPGANLRLSLWLEKQAVQRAIHVIAGSRYIAHIAQREYGIDPRRITVIPLGLDAFPSDHDGLHRDLPQDVEGPEVLYVGRLESRKGTRYLLEAIPPVIEAIPDARFRIIGVDMGDAPGNRRYQDYFASFASADAKEATTFTGFADEATLERAYECCQVFVAPSLFESFGLVHLEAMLRSKPVVACTAAATPEVVVDGETGVLVPPRDSAALAQAIRQLLRNPEEARAMGEHGRTRALTKFSIDRMVANTLAVYNSALRQSRK